MVFRILFWQYTNSSLAQKADRPIGAVLSGSAMLALCEVQVLRRQAYRLTPFPLVGEPVRQFALNNVFQAI